MDHVHQIPPSLRKRAPPWVIAKHKVSFLTNIVVGRHDNYSALFASLYGASEPPFRPNATQIYTDRFRYIELLGQGGFGVVWKVYDRWLKQYVALKISATALADEVAVLRKLPRNRYVDTFDYFRSGLIQAYTMELIDAPWMNLGEFLPRFWKVIPKEGRPPRARSIVTVKASLLIASQLLEALGHLHGERWERSNRWCHSDLKPDNAWINVEIFKSRLRSLDAGQPQFVKIGDLGLVRSKGDSHRGGTPKFSSPEQFNGGRASSASDVFAVGQMIMFIVTGETTDEDDRTHFARIIRMLDVLPSAYLREKVANLIRLMTYTNPSQRLSAAQALRSIDKLLHGEAEWLVIDGLAEATANGLPLRELQEHLFPRFAKVNGWRNRTEDRLSEIGDIIKSMRQRRMISMKGHRYKL